LSITTTPLVYFGFIWICVCVWILFLPLNTTANGFGSVFGYGLVFHDCF
jgi:hypothetical protein